MAKTILMILTLAGFASGAEMEVPDRLSVDGSSVFRNTVTINGLLTTSGSVGVGTNSLSGARLAVIGSTATAYSLAVGTSTNFSLTVSTGGNLQVGGNGQFSGTITRGIHTVLDDSMLDSFTLKLDTTTGKIKLADRIEQNIMLDAFKIAVSSSLSKFNMVDGIMDEFEDESGVDTAGSTNESYDSTNGLYRPLIKSTVKELDYMEYSSNVDAQAAYVCNTGGTITTDGAYTIHTFTESGTFTPAEIGNIQVLVVAGGGGGGYSGGGGGGGGVVYNPSKAVTALTAYTVTVGAGGPADTPGNNSVFGDITAFGGGRGGATQSAGGNGGCGGGAGRDAGTAAGGIGSQGHNGGQSGGSGWASGGGGGGAGQDGYKGGTPDNVSCSGTLAQGGDGIANSISGLSVTYAGGGGGGWSTGPVKPSGGAGGGGAGNNYPNTGGAGTPNTGGGGGGSDGPGGAGGSGIVIIRYLTSDFSVNLRPYSSTTKTQGSYSLKVVATTGAVNKTLTKTLTTNVNLTGVNELKFDIRASATGSNIKIGIHDSGGATSEITPNITSSDTFQTVNWDISKVSDANKDAIDQIITTITNADAANTFYIDNFYAPGETYNMTLKSNATVAESTPAKARIVLFEEDVDTCTLNTDITASVSRDNGTTYSTATLANEGDWSTGKRILSGIVDISTQPSGTNMKWRIDTSNNRDMKLHGVGLNWD